MTSSEEKGKIPAAVKRYVRDPVPETYTVEIFEDLHAVVDNHLIEFARADGSENSEESIIQAWDEQFRQEIETRRKNLQKVFGALLPYAFVASEVKMEYLAQAGHPEYQSGAVPDGVVEVLQDFVEIITYREELEE